MEDYAFNKLIEECKKILEKYGIEKEKIENIKIEIPPKNIKADLSIPCFQFGKEGEKVARDLENFFNSFENRNLIEKAEAIGPYLNIHINYKNFSEIVIKEILEMGKKYGSEKRKNKIIIIDYSSPNIAKPMNVGHLRSTIIGQAIYNILKFLGYKCIGDNHLGDIGTQFGKLIVAYKKWGDKEKIEKEGIKELMNLYVKFHKESNEELEEEARIWSKRLEENDKEAKRLWKWFVKISKKEFDRIYKMLNIRFDLQLGESFYINKTKEVIEDCRKIGVESEGALIIKFDDLPPLVVQRADKGSLYQTRDLATIKYRKERFDFYKCLYVVGSEQSLYFKQVFKAAEMLGYIKENECIHVNFGLMRLPEGKISTREGRVIFLEDLINKSIELAEGLIKDSEKLNEKEKKEIARKIGIGAIIFNDLKEDRVKDIIFDWNKALNLKGDSCPYVQYSAVRAKSILDSFSKKIEKFNIEELNEDEKNIIKKLSMFPKIVKISGENYKPHFIAQYLLELADIFNKFYERNRVIGSEKEIERVLLVKCFYVVIRNGLKLLNIEIPERM
jgi:arginyl-tRNA synthetase